VVELEIGMPATLALANVQTNHGLPPPAGREVANNLPALRPDHRPYAFQLWFFNTFLFLSQKPI